MSKKRNISKKCWEKNKLKRTNNEWKEFSLMKNWKKSKLMKRKSMPSPNKRQTGRFKLWSGALAAKILNKN